jgi:hypothetical protein
MAYGVVSWIRILGPDGRMKMAEALEALIAKAQKIQMTDGQLREQRLSFVYGNTHIENSLITREMVAEADEKVTREENAQASDRR